MPYWVYSFEKHGPIAFTGTKSYRRGDYRITKYYRLNCEIDEAYKGLSFDASSSFSDNLSRAIAPFDLTEGKPFTPSYLSGFYADTNDVEKDVYRTDAQDIMLNDAAEELASKSVCRRYNVTESSLHKVLRPSGYTAELAMLPVWFMSYRKGDRVCYAVVNGQTGKAAADLPIEPKKYMIGSAILAVPLFFLLNLFFTFTPATILVIAAVLALVSLLITNKQMNRIFARERGEDDKGLKSAKAKLAKAPFNEKMRTIAKPLAGMILAILILIFNPVSDWFYYIGAFVCMGSVLWAFTDIMQQHNVLTTRKLPQFNKRGGDGIA